MNEHDVERRLRSVNQGPQPRAPQSLRDYLNQLPETRPARRWMGLGFRPAFALPTPFPRLVVGSALGLAVVLGLIAGDLLLTIRNRAPDPTRPPIALVAGGYRWSGVEDPHGLRPNVAVAGGPQGYLGVGPSDRGAGILLTSADALHWSPAQTAGIDANEVDLKWLARGDNGFVAVGAAIRHDAGAPAQPRFFYSPDGVDWRAATAPATAGGAPALTVISGPQGYLAAGWNVAQSGGDVGARGTWLWTSADGLTWQGGWTQETVNGPAFLMTELDVYVVSGDPAQAESQGSGLLPIYHSIGALGTWGQTSGGDDLAHIGPAISGTAGDTGTKTLLLVWRTAADSSVAAGKTELLWADGGVYIATPVAPGSPDDLRSLVRVGETAVMATSAGGPIYQSSDQGVNWQRIDFGTAGPHPGSGKLLALGDGSLLLLGDSGIWVATPAK